MSTQNPSGGSFGHPSAEEGLSQWSCFNCRKRKVRCDRHQPCCHCSRGGLGCTFPTSGRLPTRRHNPAMPPARSKTELLERLRRLEGIVSDLSSQLESENNADLSTGPASTASRGLEAGSDIHAVFLPNVHQELPDVTRWLGQLVVHENESLYIGTTLWEAICKEVRQIHHSFGRENGLEMDSLESFDEKLLASSSTRPVPFLWGPDASEAQDLQPLPSQIPFIWEVFMESVDPFIKVLHTPTMSKAIKESKGRFSSMNPGMEALMYAVSLAAVSSLSNDEVMENFGEDRSQLVARLTLGTEQALSRAGVLNTAELSVVQAFTIYLETVEKSEGARSIWTLAGLLLRTALSMGLHRDSAQFPNITPFEAEMRRRVWWHICFLDARVGDCQVFEMSISPSMFDTREPANIDDVDLLPSMSELPPTRHTFTDTTMCIMRCELWRFSRRMRTSMAMLRGRNGDTRSASTERQHIINETSDRIVGGFYKYLDPQKPLHLLKRTLICLDFVSWDVVNYVLHGGTGLPSRTYDPKQRLKKRGASEGGGGANGEEIWIYESEQGLERDRMFLCATACLDHLSQLRTQPSTRRWSWTIRDRDRAQWHCLTVILSQLRVRPWGRICEQAWRLVQHTLTNAAVGTVRAALLEIASFVARRRAAELTRLGLDRSPSSSFAAKLATLGPPILPQMHDCDIDRRIGFDTKASQDRLALETALANSFATNSGSTTQLADEGPVADNNSVESAWDDLWADLEFTYDVDINSNDFIRESTPRPARDVATWRGSAPHSVAQTSDDCSLNLGFVDSPPTRWDEMQNVSDRNDFLDEQEATELDWLAWPASFDTADTAR